LTFDNEDAALRVIRGYGRVLADTLDSTPIASEAVLPHPKQYIMDAIHFLLTTNSNPVFREDLMSAYGRLGHFVPAESAVVSPRAREIYVEMQSGKLPKIGPSSDEWPSYMELLRVSGEAASRCEKLLNEILAFVRNLR